MKNIFKLFVLLSAVSLVSNISAEMCCQYVKRGYSGRTKTCLTKYVTQDSCNQKNDDGVLVPGPTTGSCGAPSFWMSASDQNLCSDYII